MFWFGIGFEMLFGIFGKLKEAYGFAQPALLVELTLLQQILEIKAELLNISDPNHLLI